MSKEITSLYFLVGIDHKAFKIGIANSTISRISKLGGQMVFDLKESLEILWTSRREALRAEKTLHFICEKYQVEYTKSDGFTEWFDISCFELALLNAKNILDSRGISHNQIKKGILLP